MTHGQVRSYRAGVEDRCMRGATFCVVSGKYRTKQSQLAPAGRFVPAEAGVEGWFVIAIRGQFVCPSR